MPASLVVTTSAKEKKVEGLNSNTFSDLVSMSPFVGFMAVSFDVTLGYILFLFPRRGTPKCMCQCLKETYISLKINPQKSLSMYREHQRNKKCKSKIFGIVLHSYHMLTDLFVFL